MSSFYRKQLEAWLKTVDVNAKTVLDVGGSQLPVKQRVKSWAVVSYSIVDLLTPHKGLGPTLVADLNEDHREDTRWQADVIFCLEVMEYIHDPAMACRNLAHWLKPGGTLHITFPFVYPAHEPVAEDCLRYTPQGAARLLRLVGLEVREEIPRMTEKVSLAAFYAAEGMRAAKDQPHETVGVIIKATKPS